VEDEMPIHFELCENNRVMYVRISDPWEASEMTALYPTQKTYLDLATRKLHTLLDMTDAHQMPKNVLRTRLNAPSVNHPNSGELALVSSNMLVRSLADIGFRISQFQHVRFFTNVDDAWNYLRGAIADERNQVAQSR
jgi:hypothetical protein